MYWDKSYIIFLFLQNLVGVRYSLISERMIAPGETCDLLQYTLGLWNIYIYIYSLRIHYLWYCVRARSLSDTKHSFGPSAKDPNTNTLVNRVRSQSADRRTKRGTKAAHRVGLLPCRTILHVACESLILECLARALAQTVEWAISRRWPGLRRARHYYTHSTRRVLRVNPKKR